MNIYKDKYLCCGCTACMNSCQHKAITMRPDSEGFLYPEVDKNKCINCGICSKVCPFIKYAKLRQENIAFAAKHKDDNVLASSSSGGVFTAISDYILRQGGIIYGVAFGEDFKVCHQRAITFEQRDKFRGSKYVQSDLGDTFQSIAKDLQDGVPVLFSGTPCQNAGLRNFLVHSNIDLSNLYLMDFICHGVSSPLIWKEYVSFLEQKNQSRLKDFSFRDKANGWKNFKIFALFTNFHEDRDCNNKYSYIDIYSSLYITRPSCFHCKFTNYVRPSDITVADFWNIRKYKPYMDDDKGVSTVLVNTQKGKNLFISVINDIIYEESSLEECWQPHLDYPCKQPKGRERFWQEYYSKGAAFIIKKYGKGTVASRIKRMVIPILRKTGLYAFAGKAYGKLFG